MCRGNKDINLIPFAQSPDRVLDEIVSRCFAPIQLGYRRHHRQALIWTAPDGLVATTIIKLIPIVLCAKSNQLWTHTSITSLTTHNRKYDCDEAGVRL